MKVLVLLALAATASASDAVVARLDGTPYVTESDLAAWSAAQGCYGEGALTSRRAAFMRLTEAALAERAMRENGGPDITDGAVAEDAARIDRETQAPDILACIKAALKDDYRRVFVKPSLTEARLRTYLMKDAAVQAGQKAKAEEAVRRGKRRGALEAAAKELGLHYSSATFSEAASTGAYRPDLPPAEFQAEFIKAHLADLEPGRFKDGLVETDYTFQAVRLLEKSEKGWLFETVVARKLGQEEWFAGLSKRRLEILDAELREWVKGIKGNPRLFAVEVGP